MSEYRGFRSVPLANEWSTTDIAATFCQTVDRYGIPIGAVPLAPLQGTARAGDDIRKVALLLPLLQRALRTYGGNRAELVTALRADPQLYPIDEGLSDDPGDALMFARPDIAISASGPKVLEFNTGAGIGSYTEQYVMNNAWRKIYGSSIPNTDPMRKWAEVFSVAKTRNGDTAAQVCALATRRDYPKEVLDFDKFFGVHADLLSEHGVEYFVSEPEELDSKLSNNSPDTCVGVRHFHAFEWRHHGIDFDPLQRALDRGFRFYFPQEAAMIANKRVLAWLSAKQCHLSPGESTLVDEMIPWTRELDAGSPYARDLRRYVLANKDLLVAKRCMSLGSQDVIIGRLVTLSRWRKVIDAAFVAGDSIVQEFVKPQHADIYMRIDDTVQRRRVFPILSPFFVDQQYSGCQARYMLDASLMPTSVDLNGAAMNTVIFG